MEKIHHLPKNFLCKVDGQQQLLSWITAVSTAWQVPIPTRHASFRRASWQEKKLWSQGGIASPSRITGDWQLISVKGSAPCRATGKCLLGAKALKNAWWAECLMAIKEECCCWTGSSTLLSDYYYFGRPGCFHWLLHLYHKMQPSSAGVWWKKKKKCSPLMWVLNWNLVFLCRSLD